MPLSVHAVAGTAGAAHSQADGPASPSRGGMEIHGDTAPSYVGIQQLPSEMQLAVAQYLDFDERHRLRLVNRGFDRLLAPECRKHKLLAQCRWAASETQVRSVLVEMASEAPSARARLLDALAARLLQGARPLRRECMLWVLDAVEALPATERIGPLTTMLQHPWSRASADDRAVLTRLGRLAEVAHTELRDTTANLTLNLRLALNEHLSDREATGSLRISQVLPTEARAALLATLAGSPAGRRGDVADAILRATLPLRDAQGRPLPCQLPVLRSLASSVAWRRVDRDEASLAMWHALLGAAREFPARQAAPLLARLLDVIDDAEIDAAVVGYLYARLYAAAAAMPREAEIYLHASRNRLVYEDGLEVAYWDGFLAEIGSLPPDAQAWLLTAFANEFFDTTAQDEQDAPEWRRLRRAGLESIGKLSPEIQATPLQAWLKGLASLHDDVGRETRGWRTAFRLIAQFPPPVRAILLAACVTSTSAQTQWDGLLLRTLQLPPESRGEPLLLLAPHVRSMPPWHRPTDQWRTVLDAARPLPAGQWAAMLPLLWGAIDGLPEADREACRQTLQACIARLRLSPRASVLVAITRQISTAEHRAWVLDLLRQFDADRHRARRAGSPTIAYTAEVLRLIIAPGAFGPGTSPAEAERVWTAVLAAVGEIETEARALPLLHLAQAMNSLHPALPDDARRRMQALMEGARGDASAEPAHGRKRRASIELMPL